MQSRCTSSPTGTFGDKPASHSVGGVYSVCFCVEGDLPAKQYLALRNRIRQWQPSLGTLFLAWIVLWRYRAGLPGFELPEAIQPAQEQFHTRLQLDRMADRTEDSRATQREDLRRAYAHLGKAARRPRGSNRASSANKSNRFCFSHAGSSLSQTPWKRKCEALFLRSVCDRMLVSS